MLALEAALSLNAAAVCLFFDVERHGVCVGIRSSVGNFDLSHVLYCLPIWGSDWRSHFWEQEHVPPFECPVGAVWDTHLRSPRMPSTSIAIGGAILRVVGQAVVGGWEGGGSLVRRERGTCERFFTDHIFF